MTLIDKPEGLRYFQLLQVRYALDIQATTGLVHSRGSVLKLAKRRYGVKSNTCKGAVKELDVMIAAMKLGK